MRIRIATVADALPLAKLKRDTFRETFLSEGYGIDYPPGDLIKHEEESYSITTITDQLTNRENRTWVVECEDGGLIGYAQVGPCKLPHSDVPEGAAEIYQIYIRRGAQGTGVGRKLFNSALAYLAVERPGAVWLGVWSGNTKAIAFYEKAGFSLVGTCDFKVGESTDLHLIYRC